jgi:hypothetical protein
MTFSKQQLSVMIFLEQQPFVMTFSEQQLSVMIFLEQ